AAAVIHRELLLVDTHLQEHAFDRVDRAGGYRGERDVALALIARHADVADRGPHARRYREEDLATPAPELDDDGDLRDPTRHAGRDVGEREGPVEGGRRLHERRAAHLRAAGAALHAGLERLQWFGRDVDDDVGDGIRRAIGRKGSRDDAAGDRRRGAAVAG